MLGKRAFAGRSCGRVNATARPPVRVPRSCPSSIAAARLLMEERGDCVVARAVYDNVAELPEPQWQDNQIRWSRPASLQQVAAPPGAPAVVILPGFGNASADYTAPFGSQEAGIATRLAARGWVPYVVPVERKDWFRVARAILTQRFWKGQLTTEPGYSWYLERVAATVERAVAESGAEQVVLVGHSAGGWLGRAYLADPRFQQQQQQAGSAGVALPPPGTTGAAPNPRVRAMVTLGTPQRPPPPEKKRDMTGGAQGWVDRSYPGAFFAGAGVSYVSVCGRTVRGHRDVPRAREGPRVPEEYAFDSYMEVCGEGEGVVGDCVVPLGSAMLPGARQVVADGVFHSMSKIGTFEQESGVVWYGSEDVLDCWLGPLVEELSRGGGGGGGQAVVAAVAAGAQAGSAGASSS